MIRKYKMQVLLGLCLVLCGAQFACAEEAKACDSSAKPLHVLMVGNSFSVCNVVHMPAIAAELGCDLDLASLYIGGCSLEQHWRNLLASTNANYKPYHFDRRICGVTNANSHVAGGPKIGECVMNLRRALTLVDWDIVTVQQASPLSWQSESYSPWGIRLVAAIRALAPQARVYVQETWSYTPYDTRLKSWGITPDEMFDRLHAAYAQFAKREELGLIPVGSAINAWRRERPVVYTPGSFGGDVVGGRWVADDKKFKLNADGTYELTSDPFHLNESGEYLQSLVWAARVFKRPVTNLNYRPDFVSDVEAALMQKIATEVVRPIVKNFNTEKEISK